MARTVTVKGVTIGAGAPKVIVPLTGATRDALVAQAERLAALGAGVGPDVAEWRADLYDDVEDIAAVVATGRRLAAALAGIPVLFTFRTDREGGERPLSEDCYVALLLAVVAAGVVDLVDVELMGTPERVREVVEFAHKHGAAVVMSNHDFTGTPGKDEIVARLRRMQELGADLPKIAVMPRSPADVLVLLDATYTMASQHADRPLITMAMAGDGVVSRLAGEIFGSACTFAMNGEASAPGQVPLADLRRSLALIHAAR